LTYVKILVVLILTEKKIIKNVYTNKMHTYIQ